MRDASCLDMVEITTSGLILKQVCHSSYQDIVERFLLYRTYQRLNACMSNIKADLQAAVF